MFYLDSSDETTIDHLTQLRIDQLPHGLKN